VKPLPLVFSLLLAVPGAAMAGPDAGTQAVRQWRQQHEQAIVDEYVSFLRIPRRQQRRREHPRNAEFIAAMMRARGIDSRLVTVGDASPVVFGEIRTPGAQRTIVFYAHYDGQPLDPKEWTSPPFEPTLRSQAIENGGRVLPLAAPGGTSIRSRAVRARRRRRQGVDHGPDGGRGCAARVGAEGALEHQVRLRGRGRGRLGAPEADHQAPTRSCSPATCG
jgi:hypothetical protein